MKAVWYETTGEAESVLTIGEIAVPELNAGEVMVRVHASGVNPSDVKTRAGARGPLAFDRVIPHSDGAGVIEAVGAGVSTERIGERVWIWNGAWARAMGTNAEYIVVPAEQAAHLPDAVSFEAGACLGIPASTAYYGVYADGSVEGKTILVTGGAGAVGHYAIQFAKAGGAKVITTVSGPEKAAHAETAGPDAVINYREGDAAEAILAATNGEGVDRVVEVEFGGNLEVTNKILKPNGVVATYGSMGDMEPKLPFYPMMFNCVTVRMYLVYLLSQEARALTVNGVNECIKDPSFKHMITEVYPFEKTAEAHKAVESGTLIGNVVVKVK
ncbi:NADPH:quinone reductase [Temperatibacter marinus]|uniref:NADPH:quinone reductase n=1 Tax=Temperatibacter marinus TaxID=1456591 RepID=A0AA52HA51_9PROT|nr:NADPH:quinone reductase [Temperatibacter marinus]WND03876.1 NADPH:quinone reductase [Temperatibacter marinus]